MSNSRTFTATVISAGNATGVVVPGAVVEMLAAGKRPKVVITINGHRWRSAIATKGGRSLVGISAANRKDAGISLGDEVEVLVELDTEPRVVAEPPDLAAALDAGPGARDAFERLAFGLRRRHVASIEEAKSEETRRRRIARLIDSLS